MGYCIILDLDGTLIHTQDTIENYKKLNIDNYPDLLERSYILGIDNMDQIGKKSPLWGITRPYLKQFLTFCFSFFDIVAVWSAGTKDYVKKVVSNIFRGIQRPHIVWARDKVLFNDKGQKPIKKMINENESFKGIMRMDNTFFVDDNSYVFIENPYNGILIPEYYRDGKTISNLRSNDIALLQLIKFFYELNGKQDVREIDKSNIFRIPLLN